MAASVASFSVLFSVPVCLYFSAIMSADGVITLTSLVLLVVSGLVGGASCGAVAWWIVFRPLHARLEKVRRSQNSDHGSKAGP